MIRSQYPLSAYEEQLADELGIMLWSEIPAYQVRDTGCARSRPQAVAELRENILDNGNHPSIVIWSVGNELDPRSARRRPRTSPRPSRAAHALDPTRPVALAFQGLPSIGCQAGYGPLDVLGLNDYFGWYPGRPGTSPTSSRSPTISPGPGLLPPSRRSWSASSAPRPTATGRSTSAAPTSTRASSSPPSSRPSTRRRGSSGAIYWALQDFLVRPGWTGGNPYPTPPVFHKGLYDVDGRPEARGGGRAAGVRRDRADRLRTGGRMRPPAGRCMRRSRVGTCADPTGRVATMPGRMSTNTLTRLDVRSRSRRVAAGAPHAP